MKRRKLMSLVMAASMVATMAFTGCGSNERAQQAAGDDTAAPTTEESGDDAAAPAGEGGFEKGATIGVSLPWLGTQNWKEAEVMFKEQLEAEGYNVIVQAADQKVPQQQQQIESMIENGAKVIVVGPVDGSQLGSVLEQAKAAGTYVIGYDRLIENTTGVDAVVQFGSVKTGELQAQALLEGLEKVKGEGPYNIELFGGGPADPNAPNFFKGAMSVLQPKIDDGTITFADGIDSNNSEYYPNVTWMMPNPYVAHVWQGDPLDIGEQMSAFNDDCDNKSKALGFTWDNSDYAAEFTALQNAYKEFGTTVTYGFVEPEKGIADLEAALKAAGLEEYMAAKQEALDAWAKENGVQ